MALALVAPALVVLAVVAWRERTMTPLVVGMAIVGAAVAAGAVAASWLAQRLANGDDEPAGVGLVGRPGLPAALFATWVLARLASHLPLFAGLDAERRHRLSAALDGQHAWLATLAAAAALALALEVGARRAPAPYRMAWGEHHARGTLARWACVLAVAWLVFARVRADAPGAYWPPSPEARVRDLALLARQARERPSDADAQYVHALALTDAKRYDAALPVIARAVALSPHWSDAHHLYGWSLATLGRNAEALPHLRTATQQSRTGNATWHSYVWVLWRLGKVREGAAACPHALKLNPDEAWVQYLCAGHYWYSRRREAEAIALVRRAIRGRQDASEIRVLAGVMYRARGQLDLSRAQLDTARRLAPRDWHVFLHLGLTAAVQGDAPTTVASLALADSLSMGTALASREMRRIYDDARAGRLPSAVPRIHEPNASPDEGR
jgi:tetratricopeptide (TPR) repeat protein